MLADRTLENQIEPYTSDSFNAEVQAQYFFSLYGEADITKKLNEMSGIQQSIETLLRQKVRTNYSMFLLANEEIKHVDEEMSDLKQLIQSTQNLIDDVQRNRITESKAMHRNSFLCGVDELVAMDRNGGVSGYNKVIEDAKNSVPGWLVKAPEDLAQYIVEQQYGTAVVVVLKTRAYVKTISKELHAALDPAAAATTATSSSAAAAATAAGGVGGSGSITTNTANSSNPRGSVNYAEQWPVGGLLEKEGNGPSAGSVSVVGGSDYRSAVHASIANNNAVIPPSASEVAEAQLNAHVVVLERVDELTGHLAATIKKSILNLPNSSLWGSAEQTKLLKLLIALEEYQMAAESFEFTHAAAMRKALTLVEGTASNSARGYIRELSRSFFRALLDACVTYRRLFNEHFAEPEILHLLLSWVQRQLSSYVSQLTHHLHNGMKESSALILHTLRKASTAVTMNHRHQDSSGGLQYSKSSSVSSSPGPATQDAFPELDNFYSGKKSHRRSNSNNCHNHFDNDDDDDEDVTLSIQSTMQHVAGIGPLSGLAASLDYAFTAADAVDSHPSLTGSRSEADPHHHNQHQHQPASTSGVGSHSQYQHPGRGGTPGHQHPHHPHHQQQQQPSHHDYVSTSGVQVGSCLGWMLMPEIQSMVTSYAECFLEQVETQVRQDSWMPIYSMTDLTIPSPSPTPAATPLGSKYEGTTAAGSAASASSTMPHQHQQTLHAEGDLIVDDPTQLPVSRSYEWIAYVLTHLCDEVWSLLKGASLSPAASSASSTTAGAYGSRSNTPDKHSYGPEQSQGGGGGGGGGGSGGNRSASPAIANANSNVTTTGSMNRVKPRSYTRAEMCEVEPVAVASIMRVFLRYMVEIEHVNTQGFTKLQLQCYMHTLQALQSKLLPSLQHLVLHCFFAEGVNSLHASPSMVFRTVAPRLNKLLRAKQEESQRQQQLQEQESLELDL